MSGLQSKEMTRATAPPAVKWKNARSGTTPVHHWRRQRDRRSHFVGRIRPEMVRSITWRHQDRARKFLVLFSDRHLHRGQRDPNLNLLAVPQIEVRVRHGRVRPTGGLDPHLLTLVALR